MASRDKSWTIMMARFWVSSGALLTLYVFADDFSAVQSRALLHWCVTRGADTFTFNVLGCNPELEQYAQMIDERFAPYAIPTKKFPPIPEGPPGGAWTQPWQLLRFTPESAEALWGELKGELLSYDTSGDAWLEDPVLYRGLDIMLGVTSHENEGVLRIRPDEQRLLDEAKIPYRLTRERVG